MGNSDNVYQCSKESVKANVWSKFTGKLKIRSTNYANGVCFENSRKFTIVL